MTDRTSIRRQRWALAARTALATGLALTQGIGAASAQTIVPCPGQWGVTAGNVTGQARGRTVHVRPGGYEAEVQLTVANCGEELHIASNPPIDLQRQSAEPTVYRGELNMGGVRRLFTFEVANPRRMEGGVTASDPQARVDKPMVMEFLGGGQEADIGCADDSDDAETVSPLGTEAAEALARAMRARGLQPPSKSGLSLADYIATRASDGGDDQAEPGTHYVHLRVGASGNILPSADWQDENRIECRVDKGELEPATHWLMFKVHPVADGYMVAAQLIDIETGTIERQQMGEAGRSGNGLGRAVNAAWDSLGANVGPLTDGRV